VNERDLGMECVILTIMWAGDSVVDLRPGACGGAGRRLGPGSL